MVGVINSMELVTNPAEKSIEDITREVTYVPESKNIKSLLMQMRTRQDALAVVVDEFGGAQGIVDIEDIMEEVVGELKHEYESPNDSTEWVRKIGAQEYLVSACISLVDLWDKVGVDLPEGTYNTLGGFLLSKAKVIPKTGNVIDYQGTLFEIHKTSSQAIQEVRIHW